MVPLIYILFAVGICVVTYRYIPYSKLEFDGDPLVFFPILGIFLFGGGIGAILPDTLQQHLHWMEGPNWLMRLAQVVGAVCGFLITVRGFAVGMVIFVVGLVVFGFVTLLGFIFQ